MKRILSFIVVAMFAGQAWAYDFSAVCSSGQTLYYTKISDTEVEVTYPLPNYIGYPRPSGDMVIPDAVIYPESNGIMYSVRSIGREAFYNCSGLTSVTIPNSVTSIGIEAFVVCNNLTSVTIGNSVTNIDDYAFCDCGRLTSVAIPNSVTIIRSSVFRRCIGLIEVTIPNSVTSIGDYAFQGCSSLTSVTIPNSVTSIASLVFDGCSNLTDINVESNNTKYASENGVLFNKGKTELVYYPVGKTETTYTIPNSATSIGNYAFYNCSGLTSVTIPNSVTSIGNYAFYNCIGLTSVTICNSVTSIGHDAFRDCSNATIYCECEETSKPSGWDSNWDAQTKWGCWVVSAPLNRAPQNVKPTITGENYLLIDDYGALWFLKDAIDPTVTVTFNVIKGSHWGYGENENTRTPYIINESVTGSKTYIFNGWANRCYENSDAAVAPTCTETGLTAGKHCSVCGDVLIAQEIIPATGHTYSSAITAPTCTTVGFTTHTCSVCEHTYNSDTIAAKGHKADSVEFENIVLATCTVAGSKDSVVFCSVCQVEVSREEHTIPALGHTEATDAAIAATCTAAGKTEGKHCSVCNAVLVAQQDVEALGHTEATDAAVAATCTAAGKTEGKHCSVCNVVLVTQQEVEALGHTEVTDAAVAATCTAAGKTEGKHCSVCNAVLVAQQEVEALGHKFEKYTYNNDATTVADGTETAVCERGCGTTDTRVAEGTKLSEPEKGTAVTDAATSTLNIYTRNNVIVVENAPDEISVYDAMGRLICRDAINRVRAENRTEIRVTTPGIYIVKVGGTAKRVMVN